MSVVRRGLICIAATSLSLVGCSSSSDDAGTDDAGATTVATETSEATETTAAPETTVATTVAPTTTAAAEPLQILVTNDDGVDAPGIDALVTSLTELDNVEVTVVAPATNQSGSSMSLTEGDLVGTDAATASGYAAITVEGFPADSVRWAFENLDIEFDLVVSGSNSGQNIGPFSLLSGTVGAARYAAQNGVPGVAVSQGLADVFDFPASVDAAVVWVMDHRADYEAGTVSIWSINSPSCATGTLGTVEVPLGLDAGDRNLAEVDCESTKSDFVDDIDGFINGYTVITELQLQPEG